MKHDLTEGRKFQIKSVVESVHSAIAAYQAQEAAGKMSREQAQKAAAEIIGSFRYGGADGKA